MINNTKTMNRLVFILILSLVLFFSITTFNLDFYRKLIPADRASKLSGLGITWYDSSLSDFVYFQLHFNILVFFIHRLTDELTTLKRG